MPIEPQIVAREFSAAMAAPIEIIVRKYAALDATDDGRIINTDFVRLLCPQYRENPALYAPAIHQSASQTAVRIFSHYLKTSEKMPGHGVALFMAGGPGSGKGTALEALLANLETKPKFIFDQTFSGYTAIAQIDDVLAHDLDAHVIYIHRPVELATIGIVTRFLDQDSGEQRTAPLDYIADRHFNSQMTFRNLLRDWHLNDFQKYDRLTLELIDNTQHGAPNARAFREQSAIDFLAQKNIVYHDAKETYTRTQRAFASVAFLLRDEIRSIFDAGASCAQSQPGSLPRLDSGRGEKLAQEPPKERDFLGQLDALRSGASDPEIILPLLYRKIAKESGFAPTATFKLATRQYATRAVEAEAFARACVAEIRSISKAWTQRITHSVRQKP